jgi:S1-C subfamily serine protease
MVTGRFKSSTVTTVRLNESAASRISQAKPESGLSAAQIYERDAPGVVLVNAVGVTTSQSAGEYLKGEGGEQAVATGSGFEIDGRGDIVTNWHAVAGAAKITISFRRGDTVTAQLVGKEEADDLALLRAPVGGVALDPIRMGDSNVIKVGDAVFAIGSPFGLGGTLTTGIISALNRRITAPDGMAISGVLQTDAPVNPGNSGGPLINEMGEAIGINSQIESSGNRGGSVGIAFAVPIDAVKRDIVRLVAGR